METERYLLESEGETGGILVREGRQFIFHASAKWAWRLQHRKFENVSAAQNALDGQRRQSGEAA